MIIEEADFRMESIGDNLHFWDLSVLKTIKSKDGERQEFKVIGYGLPISACIQRIADYRIECKSYCDNITYCANAVKFIRTDKGE